MVHPLEGIREKIERADVHMKTLKDEIRAFIESDPYTLTLNFNPQSGRYDLIAHVHAEPPLRFGVILGDAVHNLRSSLDHLIWQIVVTLGIEPAGKQTAFPIFEDSDEFERRVTIPRKRGKKSYLLGVDDETFAAIERLQPYHRVQGKINALSILGALSDVDKHQVVHSSLYALTEHPPTVDGTGFVFADVRWGANAIEDGAKIASMSLHGSTLDDEVEVQAVFPVDVRFGEMGIPFMKIYEVREGVVSVLNHFTPGFGPVSPAT